MKATHFRPSTQARKSNYEPKYKTWSKYYLEQRHKYLGLNPSKDLVCVSHFLNLLEV